MLKSWLSTLQTTKKHTARAPAGRGLWLGTCKKGNFNSSSHLHGCKGPPRYRLYSSNAHKQRLHNPLFLQPTHPLHAIAPIPKRFRETCCGGSRQEIGRRRREWANKQTPETAAATTIPLFSARVSVRPLWRRRPKVRIKIMGHKRSAKPITEQNRARGT
jgi:hypothetical protein